MRILALIPARGQSKGVPRKNIRPLGGKPLLAWTIETALACQDRFADILLSTEDEEIAAIGRAHGAWVPFLRSRETAGDNATSIEVVTEVLAALAEMGRQYDAVCLLQPTVPFRHPGFLRAAIDKFSAGGYTGLVSARRIPDHYHPNWAFVADGDGLLEPAQGPGSVIPRRQSLPPAFIRDGSVYLTTVATLKDGEFYGDRLGYYDNPHPARVNIDTLADWRAAEEWLESHPDD